MHYLTVIGSLNVDLVVRTPRTPQAGETLAGDSFHLIPGGKGANQAVAAARAGAPTRMIGCVGMDAFGPALLESLAKADVDTAGVHCIDGISTGTATILVEQSGENRIIVVPGANGFVSVDVINRHWEEIRASSMLLLQHEIPLTTVHHCIERAAAAGIRVVLNPAPIYPIPRPLLQRVDFLVVNEIEAGILTGLGVGSPEAGGAAAQLLHSWGVHTVLVTLGAGGAVLVAPDTHLYQPAYSVTVVDTTAAGDTFTGGFAAAILNGATPSEALHYALAAAALAVTRLGAQTSIPSRAEVEAWIAVHTNQTFSTT